IEKGECMKTLQHGSMNWWTEKQYMWKQIYECKGDYNVNVRKIGVDVKQIKRGAVVINDWDVGRELVHDHHMTP
ncbi:4176_t:CDS:2, partial [Racocetra persica]